MIAGKAPTVGRLPAAERGQQEARARYVTDFGLREDRLIRGDRDVGGELVPETGPHRPTIDGGDDRFAQPPHMLPFDDALALAALTIFDEFGNRLAGRIGIASAGFVLALVEAGAERGAGAGEDHDPDRAVVVRLVEGAVQ